MNNNRIEDLLAFWVNLPSALSGYHVQGLCLDSRQLKQGDTFIALKGHHSDGRQFIDQAVQQGASLVLAEADEAYPHQSLDYQEQVPVFYIEQLNLKLSELAARFYAANSVPVIAVTGTNGKTTVSQLIAQWLNLLGEPSAVMGTTGNGFLDALQPANNTTPDALTVQAQLASFAQQGAKAVAMEVSSHGLAQARVAAQVFAAAVFTNLSRDHLDYHQTMAQYEAAKLSLFTAHQVEHAIINVDDEVGALWVKPLTSIYQQKLLGVSLRAAPDTPSYLYAEKVDYSEQGIQLQIQSSWGSGSFSAPLIGEFNASNLLLALGALLSLGYDLSQLMNCAAQLTPVIGRMELFQAPEQAKVVVDYAHTPDALEKALLALRVHCQGKLWAIFGCGGDRDKGKRPLMAQVAEHYADGLIITDDNPRSEDPQAIVADMLAGLTKPEQVHIEHSRRQALQWALNQANAQDIILLAGKGHEDYQCLAHQVIHYSDRETAQALLGIKA